MIDASSLEVFLAIVEHGHFVRAADSLGIAQSVASKRLARLEDALGTRLLDRGNRTRITLTRSGRLFLDEARSALAALNRAERIGQTIARGAAGPLKVGYVFSAAMCGALPALIGGLREALPHLELMPSLMDTPAQLRAIGSGSLDVAIVRPRPTWPEKVEAIALRSEPLVIAMGARMELAGAESVHAADLVGQIFLTPQFHEVVGLAEAVRDLARAAGLPPPKIRRTDDFITAASFAAAGEGVILAPRSLQNLRLPDLTFRPIADYAANLDLVLLARVELPDPLVAELVRSFACWPSVSQSP